MGTDTAARLAAGSAWRGEMAQELRQALPLPAQEAGLEHLTRDASQWKTGAPVFWLAGWVGSAWVGLGRVG